MIKKKDLKTDKIKQMIEYLDKVQNAKYIQIKMINERTESFIKKLSIRQ